MLKFSGENGLAQLLAYIKTLLGEKVDIQAGKGLSTNDFSNELKWKLDGIEEKAQVNQNAFSSVRIGENEISASSERDFLLLEAGENVNLDVNVEEKSLTISSVDTTYEDATKEESGLMSGADKEKLDNLNTWLNDEVTPLSNLEIEALTK
jgi:hypothetical protein